MIQLQNIEKSFAKTKILTDINLHIQKGELLVIKGVSGSGKSTLLHIIASFMKPSSGAVVVNGGNIASLSDYHASEYRANSIGYITQNFYLFDALTVEQNLLSATLLQNLTQEETKKSIDKALKSANIENKATQKVSTLSGGEKQRVIIARAIVNNPQILLCDEPTANLDSLNAGIFLEIIARLKKEGATIVIATHDPLVETFDAVSRIVEIKEGSFV